MKKVWADSGWEDYLYWQAQDKKMLKKINALLQDIERTPCDGTGKPEPLKGDWSGWYSRRIDSVHRLIYRIEAGHIEIARCRGHYGDK